MCPRDPSSQALLSSPPSPRRSPLPFAIHAHDTPRTANIHDLTPAILPTYPPRIPWWAERHPAHRSAGPRPSRLNLLLIGDSHHPDYEKSSPPAEDFLHLESVLRAPQRLTLTASAETPPPTSLPSHTLRSTASARKPPSFSSEQQHRPRPPRPPDQTESLNLASSEPSPSACRRRAFSSSESSPAMSR